VIAQRIAAAEAEPVHWDVPVAERSPRQVRRWAVLGRTPTEYIEGSTDDGQA